MREGATASSGAAAEPPRDRRWAGEAQRVFSSHRGNAHIALRVTIRIERDDEGVRIVVHERGGAAQAHLAGDDDAAVLKRRNLLCVERDGSVEARSRRLVASAVPVRVRDVRGSESNCEEGASINNK